MNDGSAPTGPPTPGTPGGQPTGGVQPGESTPSFPAGDRTGPTPPGDPTGDVSPGHRDPSPRNRLRGPDLHEAVPRLEIIAHRGSSHEFHQNTLDALRHAAAHGAHRLETDVRRTRDGVLVLHHDPHVMMAAANGVRRPVPAGQALAAENFDVGAARAREAGFELLRLDHALEALGPEMYWDIELKEEGYESEVVDTVLRQVAPQRVVFTSFLDSALKRIKAYGPDLEVGLVLGVEKPRWGLITRLAELHPLRRAHACGASVLVPNRRFLPFGFLRNVRGFEGRIWVWTVNRDADIRRLGATPGVHGVITDLPDSAQRLLTGR